MTNRPTPDDEFDDIPSLPGRQGASPFDDLDGFDDVSSPSPLSKPAIDPRYAEISRELSRMDAVETTQYSTENDDHPVPMGARLGKAPHHPEQPDYASIDDLSLSEDLEPPESEFESVQAMRGDLGEQGPLPDHNEVHIGSTGVHLHKDDLPIVPVTPKDADIPAMPPPVRGATIAKAPNISASADPEYFDQQDMSMSDIEDLTPAIAPSSPYVAHNPIVEDDIWVDQPVDVAQKMDVPDIVPDQLSSDEGYRVMGSDQAPVNEVPMPQPVSHGPAISVADMIDDDLDVSPVSAAIVQSGTTVSPAAAISGREYDFDDDNDDETGNNIDPEKISAMHNLPRIPLIELSDLGFDRVAFSYNKRVRAVFDTLQRRYSIYGVDFLPMIDRKCSKWLSASKTPYRNEIEAIANKFKKPGTYALNVFFEFGCTSAVAPDLDEEGARLLHTLDWPLNGLGSLVVAVRRQSPHGKWVNITWPGYVGCLQGIAPGRFAAAINQAPYGNSKNAAMNWVSAKMRWLGQKDMPPSFLLRKVFEECKDFDAAVSMLEKVPISSSAIFSIVGPEEGEFAIIERTETERKTTKRQPAVTNHWLNNEFSGRAVGYKSEDRLFTIKSRLASNAHGWDWLRVPVLNPTTQLAMDLNPKTARMKIIGYHGLEPATRPLDIYAD